MFCNPTIEQDVWFCSAVSFNSWFYVWCLTPWYLPFILLSTQKLCSVLTSSEVFCRPINQHNAGSSSSCSFESWFYGWCLTPQHIWRLFCCQLKLKFSTAPKICVSQLRTFSVFFFFFRLASEIGFRNKLSTAVTCWLLYMMEGYNTQADPLNKPNYNFMSKIDSLW